MRVSILTLFPEMFVGPFDYSILKRAKEKEALTIDFVNIRDFGIGKHKIVDDKPYGGGVGMILRVDVVQKAIKSTKHQTPSTKCKERTILLDPRGERFAQAKARELSALDHLILVCGHYEGVDERILHFVDEQISIGDYVLTGGELPAMVIVDALVRLLPSVLKAEATAKESFSQEENRLEHPQYTRPEIYQGWEVPKILLSGDHAKLREWQTSHSRRRG